MTECCPCWYLLVDEKRVSLACKAWCFPRVSNETLNKAFA